MQYSLVTPPLPSSVLGAVARTYGNVQKAQAVQRAVQSCPRRRKACRAMVSRSVLKTGIRPGSAMSAQRTTRRKAQAKLTIVGTGAPSPSEQAELSTLRTCAMSFPGQAAPCGRSSPYAHRPALRTSRAAWLRARSVERAQGGASAWGRAGRCPRDEAASCSSGGASGRFAAARRWGRMARRATSRCWRGTRAQSSQSLTLARS